MILLEAGGVLTVLILWAVILWSSVAFPGFLAAVKTGKRGKAFLAGFLIGALCLIGGIFRLVYTNVEDPLVRAFCLIAAPMFLGIPLKGMVAVATRNWLDAPTPD